MPISIFPRINEKVRRTERPKQPDGCETVPQLDAGLEDHFTFYNCAS